ncbi:MAG: hypothetical protein FWD60_03445 [Candidatus Azobacteroides sp.]|nr:hypothetical protein [Candidatus Azobacteroides sp.]
MDIVISGTKGGWGYFTDNKPSGLFDIGSGAGIKALTYQAYAINYKDNNCIFTKYRIVKDVRGDKRIGFVAFSLFLPFDDKMSGKTIKTILDRVESEYCQKYITDGKNLEDVRENFSFLETISKEYDKDIRSNTSVVADDMQSGITDAAFVYFPYTYKDIQTQKETKFELEDIFDAPFQEEYTPYRQILFINNDLKGKDENPLVALKHSENNLTGRVDLKNEYYYLNNYNRNKGVKISAYYNNKWNERFDGKGNNQIRAKWKVEIKYSKDDRCYEQIFAQGTISDPASKIHNYLEIKGNQIFLKYDAFNNPTPKIQPVTLEIKDVNGKYINDAEIQIGSQPWTKINDSIFTINFKGEDNIRQWTVMARKGKSLASSQLSFTPAQQNKNIDLVLEEYKNVTFQITDDEGLVFDYIIQVKDKKGIILCSGKSPITFSGENIDKSFTITVWSNKHKDEDFSYCPAKDENPKLVKLTKKQFGNRYQEGNNWIGRKKYYLKIDKKFGKRSYKREPICEYEHNFPRFKCDPQFGYKFVTWELHDEPYQHDGIDYDGYYEALFKELWYHKIPKFVWILSVIAIPLAVAITFTLRSCSSKNDDKNQPIDVAEIQMYVEGDSLLIEKLTDYKKNWQKQENDFIKKSGGGLFGGDETFDSAKWRSEWQPAYESIERAITKRELINRKQFAEIKYKTNNDELKFGTTQVKLKDAIFKIDSTKYDLVSQDLGDVNALTLTQIADKINEILTTKEPTKEEQLPESKKEEKKAEPKQGNLKSTEQQKQSTQMEQNSETTSAVSTDNISKIIQYIKESELDEVILKEYKNTKGINQNLKNSIQLCLDFWALDGSGSGKNPKTYWNFRDKVNADKNFNNSKLKAFLDKMCNEDNPSYSKMDKKRGLK